MKFTSAEVIVQRQLDACNARDVEALLATCAQDAHEFEFPGRPLASAPAATHGGAATQGTVNSTPNGTTTGIAA